MFRPSPNLKTLAGIRTWFAAALAVGMLTLSTSAAQAAPIQFGSFQNSSGNPFTFVNNGNGTANFSVSTDVVWNFTAATGLDPKDRLATLTITGGTTAQGAGDNTPGTILSEPINGANNVMTIVEKSTGQLILSMAFTGILSGQDGGPNASIIGANSVGDKVVFASDFLAFEAIGNSYLLNMPTVSPGLAILASKYIEGFTTNINGQFTAIASIPQPTSVVMFGTGMAATVVLARRGRRRLTGVARGD